MARKKQIPGRLALLAVALLMTAACSSGLVRGEPPYVKIHSLRMDAAGPDMELRLGVRNINDVAIKTAWVAFKVTLGDAELAHFDGPVDASVIANGSETLRFNVQASAAGRQLLQALETGEMPNLAYDLEGSIRTVEGDSLEFEGSSRLYPVPGRPGQFR